jgi:hypothetical protein
VRRRAVPLLLGLLLSLGTRRLLGQSSCSSTTSCSVAVTFRLPQPNVVSLALTAATTTLPPLTAQAMGSAVDVAGPTMTVRANAPYRVTVQSATATWAYSGAGENPQKPASDLLWGPTATGPWVSSATSATLWPSSGQVAPATSGQSLALFYRTQWSWTTSPPGAYSLPVNITLTSP